MADDPLSERERQVLQALIDAHIQTSEPVGSKALAQITATSLPEGGVSPATIRNVLAALHDKGFIEQPHTSAGRVPTDRGLRYYVDFLLRYETPAAELRGEISHRIEGAGAVDEALREATKVLTRMSRHTAIVVLPRAEDARLRAVELVRLRDDAALLILVTNEGKVHNRLLEWRGEDLRERAPDAATLERLARQITDVAQGKTIEEAREALKERRVRQEDELSALQRVVDGLTRQDAPEVHVEGASHLLDTARSLERARELLALLEEGARVKALLDQAARAPGIRIFIGEENATSALFERGLVTAPIGPKGALGLLGVIGPRHLDYGRVVPLVDLTARVVSRTVQG
jgi:heat-inducible transcriptional repressor